MNKYLHRTISLILATLLLCLSITACSKTDPTKSDSQTTEDNGGLLGGTPDNEEKDEEYISEDEKWGRVAEGMLGTHGGRVSTYNGYLGYGYNMITAAYYNQKDINSAHPVVDMESLARDNKVYVESDFANYTDPKIYISSSTKEYAHALSAKASVRGGYPLVGSFKANFNLDTSYQMNSNQRLVTLQANLETRKDYILENSPKLLAKHAAEGFKEAVETLYTELKNLPEEKYLSDSDDNPIAAFIRKYGTHVLTNVTMGGRFDLNYLYTRKSTSSMVDIEASLQASYRYVSGSASVHDVETKKEIVENSSLQIKTYGGSVTVDPGSIEKAISSYSEWSKEVKEGKITLVDASEVIQLWDIIKAMDAKYADLSIAVGNYCETKRNNEVNLFKNTIGVDTPTTYISEIFIGTGKTSVEAKTMLRSKGILEKNIVQLDLNRNAGGDWIYLGYKTTTSSDKAITHILADYFNSAQTKGITSNGFSMNILNSNLNSNAGGKYIYLYYTRDKGAGKPITEIKYQYNETFEYGNADGYYVLKCFTTGAAMDLNMDTNKRGDIIYLWYKRG